MEKQKNWTGERLEPGVFNETSIEHLHRYAFAADLVTGKKVLDIACGEGYGSALLARNAAHVTGVDIDSGLIQAAKSKYNLPNIEFLTGSVDNIPSADQQFDVIVCFETIEHVTTHQEMMKQIKRVLKAGGLLIISTPDKKNYTDKPARQNPFHAKELYADEFRALLGEHFRNVSLYDQQISFSSVITGKEAIDFVSYKGDFNRIEKDQGENRIYCIALASDETLPQLENSLFNGSSVFASAVTEKENQVINSITYKVGHAILYPAKLLRNLFKKPNRHD